MGNDKHRLTARSSHTVRLKGVTVAVRLTMHYEIWYVL